MNTPIVYVSGRRVRNRARIYYRFYGDRLVWLRKPPVGARIQIIRAREIV